MNHQNSNYSFNVKGKYTLGAGGSIFVKPLKNSAKYPISAFLELKIPVVDRWASPCVDLTQAEYVGQIDLIEGVKKGDSYYHILQQRPSRKEIFSGLAKQIENAIIEQIKRKPGKNASESIIIDDIFSIERKNGVNVSREHMPRHYARDLDRRSVNSRKILSQL